MQSPQPDRHVWEVASSRLLLSVWFYQKEVGFRGERDVDVIFFRVAAAADWLGRAGPGRRLRVVIILFRWLFGMASLPHEFLWPIVGNQLALRGATVATKLRGWQGFQPVTPMMVIVENAEVKIQSLVKMLTPEKAFGMYKMCQPTELMMGMHRYHPADPEQITTSHGGAVFHADRIVQFFQYQGDIYSPARSMMRILQ